LSFSEIAKANLVLFLINHIEGMMHLMDHDNVNEYLAKLMETEGLNVELSYDGLCVPVTL
jgi:hypothetical protein